jgi:hypothetical protein
MNDLRRVNEVAALLVEIVHDALSSLLVALAHPL